MCPKITLTLTPLARASNPSTIGKNIYVNRKVNALFTPFGGGVWKIKELFVYSWQKLRDSAWMVVGHDDSGNDGGADYDGDD